MKNLAHKVFSVFASAVLVLSMCPLTSAAAFAKDEAPGGAAQMEALAGESGEGAAVEDPGPAEPAAPEAAAEEPVPAPDAPAQTDPVPDVPAADPVPAQPGQQSNAQKPAGAVPQANPYARPAEKAPADNAAEQPRPGRRSARHQQENHPNE